MVNDIETLVAENLETPAADTARLRMQRYLYALGYSTGEAELRINAVELSFAEEEAESEKLTISMQRLKRMILQSGGELSSTSEGLNRQYRFQAHRAHSGRAWSMPAARRIAMAPHDFEPRMVKRVKGWLSPARTWL